MNSKTLEMLEKFVGEEDNEDFENLGEKINIFGEQKNENKLNDNELIANNDDINKLFEKINNYDSIQINENKNTNESNENNNDPNNNNTIKKDKLEILLKLFQKKENSIKLKSFNHWKNLILNNIEEKKKIDIENNNEKFKSANNIELNININEEEQREEVKSCNNEIDNSLNEILSSNKEEDFDEHTQSEIITRHQNQLLSGEINNNDHIMNSFNKISDINIDNFFPQNKTEDEINPTAKTAFKNILVFSLYNIFKNKLYLNQKTLFSVLKHKSIISNYYDKLYQLDKLNKKYEAILDEKSSIIINKTDEMEEMKEKIEKLTKSLKEANKKNKNLNVIQESICAKCGLEYDVNNAL